MDRVETFEFNGYTATVIRPEKPNGKWIWKTEFLYAFDQAERDLLDLGYTRVYYQISDKYGSYKAVRLMHNFYLHVTEKYGLDKKAILFGFSRGGLYAFNFTLAYPEYVEKVYLDAPVLDVRTWPWAGSKEQAELFEEYDLTAETLAHFKGMPIENLAEYFALNIPTMIIAGVADEVVPFDKNSGKLLAFAKENGIEVRNILKPEGLHHPHGLDDTTPVIDFVTSK